MKKILRKMIIWLVLWFWTTFFGTLIFISNVKHSDIPVLILSVAVFSLWFYLLFLLLLKLLITQAITRINYEKF